MNCDNKIKNTCSEKNYATCIYYEGAIPSYSPLINENCVTTEEVILDLYAENTSLKSNLNLSIIGTDCLQYVLEGGQLKVKNVLLKYEEEICVLKEKVRILEEQAICDKDITQCLDLTGLSDQCTVPITNLGQLLQYLLTNIPPLN